MRIAGKSVAERVTRRYTIEREGKPFLSFQLTAPPLTFEHTMLDRVPLPVPPRKYVMKGDHVAKDVNNRPISEDNTSDPEFRKKLRRVSVLQTIGLVHEALRGDKEVSWDTPEPPPGGSQEAWVAFYEKILEEFISTGITQGEFQVLSESITNLSSLSDGDIEEARKRFLPSTGTGEKLKEPEPPGT